MAAPDKSRNKALFGKTFERRSKCTPPPPAKSTSLVVWDFDWSLINENSDTFVVEKLDPSRRIWEAAERKLEEGMQWTALMDWVVGALHEAGHDAAAFEAALGRIPTLSGAMTAVELARQTGAELRILSDANTLYIQRARQPDASARPQWILAALGLSNAFTVVETNGAVVEPSGRLRVSPHQPSDVPHKCKRCPSNLCKGAVLERWLSEDGDDRRARRCAYVGDGGGDFCPALHLRPGDVLFARRAPHDSLLRKCRESGEVRARVVEWGDDDDGASLFAGFRDFLEAQSSEKRSRPE